MNSVPFLEAFRDITSEYPKIPKSKFMASGSFPIIDQGKRSIAGYFDDDALAVDRGGVVVFGDHTRAVKFVEGPFAVGADGTKVLMPMPGVFPRYAYRWLEAQEVPSLGYSRHFKLLKELSVPVRNEGEQRRIADILDKSDALREKRREAIAHLDALEKSIFHEMFGLPSQNNHRWPIVTIGSLLISAQYGTSEKSEQTGGVPVLRMGNVTYEGHLDLTDLKYLAEGSAVAEKYLLGRGDVVFNRTNSPDLVGKTALFNEANPYSFAGYLIRLRCGADLDPQYLTSFMNTPDTKTKLRSMCKSIVGMANINAKEVQAMSVMHPPIELQKVFARHIAAIEDLREKHRAQLAELDELFVSLQDRAFNGEL